VSYISSSLKFYNNKIVVEDTGSIHNGIEVMMDWESPIMSASAAYVTEGGGDILEIGFGMGISANYIQSHSISSHTIVENHPQIITKAVEWASGKSNVTIVSQSWYDVKDSIGKFDGIFYDTYGDDNINNFSSSLKSLTKNNCKVTFFWQNDDSEPYPHTTPPIESFQQIPITAEANSYFTGSTIYYMPKTEIS
jgi:cyclopropane fatty-acyl-phospholipid synthase-like methyltransferase